MRNPHFGALLERMLETHEKKSHDYASDANVYSNFEYAERLSAPFTGVHKVFATMVGIKLARLGELLSGKTPKNESIFDSFLDLCTYACIWAAYYMSSINYELPFKFLSPEERYPQLMSSDCIPVAVSSRVCQRGTKSCEVPSHYKSISHKESYPE
jgi:hypothetical protein